MNLFFFFCLFLKILSNRHIHLKRPYLGKENIKYSGWGYASFNNESIDLIDEVGWETRTESVLTLLYTGYFLTKRFLRQDIRKVGINTGDGPPDHCLEGNVCFSIAQTRENAHRAFPDFNFDHWRQVGILDYGNVNI